ncbi:MAG: flagellar protein FlgN [Eubacterium sp.]|nr:flagellar protein FlgN [Eubacterium sp.]
MASLMDDLIQVLENENKEYEHLAELSKEKKQVIIDANVPALEKIVDLEQDVASKIQNLDNRRQKVMHDMSVVLNKPGEDFTVDTVIEMLSSQPKEQERLQNVKKQLKTTLDEVRKINEQNQTLLNQALELVEFDLTLFRSMRTAPETANYDKNAYNTGEILGGSGFDAKQ